MDWQGGSRPHIIYNPTTQKYVGWADTEVLGYSVASSSRPDRGYVNAPPAAVEYQSNPDWMSGDVAVEAFGKTLLPGLIRVSSTNGHVCMQAIRHISSGQCLVLTVPRRAASGR